MPTPPVRRRRSTEEVRTLLLEAARDVFSRFGYAGASTRQIANEAGVTEVLIFRHFESKRGLFEAAVVEPFAATITNFIEDVAELTHESDMVTMMNEFVTSVYDVMLEHREMVIALVAASHHDVEDEGPGTDALVGALETFTKFIEREARRRELPDMDYPVTAALGIATAVGMAVLQPWLFGRSPSRQRIDREMAAFMLYGVVGDRSSQR